MTIFVFKKGEKLYEGNSLIKVSRDYLTEFQKWHSGTLKKDFRKIRKKPKKIIIGDGGK